MFMIMVCNDAMQSLGASRQFREASSLHEFDGKPRKSTWRAGINECRGNQNKLQSSQEGTLRSLGAEGGPCVRGLDSALLS